MYWETDIVKDVSPVGLDLTIRHKEAFGWILNDRRYRDGLYTLEFIRDQSRGDYIKLVEAEYEYESVSYPNEPAVSVLLFLGIIIALIGAFISMPLVAKIPVCILGGVGFVWGIVITVKKKKAYKKEWSRVHDIKMEALRKGL